MSILRLSTLSLALAIAVFSLGYVNSSSAAPKNCVENDHRPSCNGGGGDGDKNLQARFDLTIVPTSTLKCDFDCEYQDSNRDHVGVFTGSGPGFRFDTNLQNGNKMSRFMSARFVSMDFPDKAPAAYEIDFRFQNPGLDLGSLNVGASGRVAAALNYYGGNQVVGFDALNHGILGFGSLNAPTHPDAEACLDAAGEIKVTRNSATQWTLESPASGKGKACRFAVDANGDIECTRETADCDGAGDNPDPPELIDFKFEFTIEEQE